MMKNIVLILAIAAVSFINAIHAVECETGWTLYKDETCIRVFNELLSYNDARHFCASKSNSLSTATMVTVKEPDMQHLLGNYTQDIYEHIWLGAKYDVDSAQFKWDDGDLLTYSNWAEGYPRNISDPDVCIHLRPTKAGRNLFLEGNWEDAICQRRNLVMCQRTVTWTMEDATREIMKLRKRDLILQEELRNAHYDRNQLRNQLQEQIRTSAVERNEIREELNSANDQVNNLRQQLQAANNEIQNVNGKVVPVGTIYVEYNNQPSPSSLWPTLIWEDVTSSYAGMFFRASGGTSESWGMTQFECAPRISHVEYYEEPAPGLDWPTFVSLPTSGWSNPLLAGSYFNTGSHFVEKLKFHVEICEVRPINQAIRIWKRMA